MNAQTGRLLYRLDWPLVPISVLVLLGCLFYAFAYAFLSPYSGITLGAGDAGWIVNYIDPCDAHPRWCSTEQGNLQLGDQLIAIGNLTFEEYRQDRRRVRFGGYDSDDSVPITLIDNGERQIIHWIMPPITPANRLGRLGSLLISLPFWLAGTVVLLLLQPRDMRWRLLISFNYMTAIWLAVGMVSGSHVAASSLVLHAVSWLLVPIYLHLHFLIPSPFLGRFPRYAFVSLYAMAIFLAALELFQLLPYSAYTMGVLLAMGGQSGIAFPPLVFQIFSLKSTGSAPDVDRCQPGVWARPCDVAHSRTGWLLYSVSPGDQYCHPVASHFTSVLHLRHIQTPPGRDGVPGQPPVGWVQLLFAVCHRLRADFFYQQAVDHCARKHVSCQPCDNAGLCDVCAGFAYPLSTVG